MTADEDSVMDVNEEPSETIHLSDQPAQVARLLVQLKGGDHAISGRTQSGMADGEKLIIGRSKDADVWVFDEQASRHHACLSANENDGNLELTAMDMKSSNGTRVNGHPANLPIVIHSGDIIGIGDMKIEVVIG